MATIGESSSSLPKLTDEKPMIVRVKRKASQSRLDALWLEINDRPVKRPLLDFENLSISESSKKDEFKAKKIFVQHVETLRNSKATIDIVQSFVAPDAAENKIKNEERRRDFKREISKQDQLLVKARQEQEVLAKTARFEQIWRSRKAINDATEDPLQNMYHIYDIVRVDTNESDEVTQDHMSLEDQSMLSSYLPLLRELIPHAAAEIETDINANLVKHDMPIDDYVYDYYTVKSDMEITDDDASNPFPLVQVNDLDLYDGLDDSDYESDDSNAEKNPVFDYPDEISEEEEELESEASNDESEDNDVDSDRKQSSEASDELSEIGAQLREYDTYGDFEDDGDSFDDDDDDNDNDGGNDKGEDWRWSYR